MAAKKKAAEAKTPAAKKKVTVVKKAASEKTEPKDDASTENFPSEPIICITRCNFCSGFLSFFKTNLILLRPKTIFLLNNLFFSNCL